MFPLYISLLPFLFFAISTADDAEKPNLYDPESYTCQEEKFNIQTRRSSSEKTRARPGDWKTTCQNERMVLDCGSDNEIKIIDAEYGRTDDTTCHEYPSFIVSCTSSQAYYKVHQRCDHKQKCEITAENNEFGNPCPGFIKYLKVKYTCEPVPKTNLESKIICEKSSDKLTCPKGKTLLIYNAFYGRSDSTTCPHTHIKDTNCIAKNSLDIISSKCDYKHECDLSSSNGWFEDPCKGTYKYLKIEYQCVIDDLQYATACENGIMEIECKESSVITVVRAEYGRVHPYICNNSPKPINPNGCSSPNEISIVYDRCHGQKRCVIPATNEVFGDPCVGITKYLEVDFYCEEIWDEQDAPGEPIIKALTKGSVTFSSDKFNESSSQNYIVQMKDAEENNWSEVLDGAKGLDFSKIQTIKSLKPDTNLDIRIVKKKEELSNCLAFTRFRTRA